MERTVSKKGIKRIYWAVSACFMVLAAWLYCKEDVYIKILDLEIVPNRGQIQVEILADGKNQHVSLGERQVELYVERQDEGGKTRLLIHGECEEERKEPVAVKVVSDAGDWQEGWSYKVHAGEQQGEIRFETVKNSGRIFYLWISVLMAVLPGIMWFREDKSPGSRELADYAGKVMEKLELEPGMERYCGEGKRLFAVYRRQRVLSLMLAEWMWVFSCFCMLQGLFHERIVSEGLLFYVILGIYMAGFMTLSIFISRRWGNLMIEILVGDCRPVTAAVVYLLMGNYGIERKLSRFLLHHNGASGLYRSGHCREALEISEMAWQMLSKKPGDYTTFVHSSLKYQCLKVLEEHQAAAEEKEKMEALLQNNPGLRRRKGIQRFLGIQDICQWIETGEIERAERSAKEILGQWKEGYYRLPILGLMAELKEFLGKEDEEAALRQEILTFSPENKEVRQVMGEGRLSYRPVKAKAWDPVLTAVWVMCAAVIAGCVFSWYLWGI